MLLTVKQAGELAERNKLTYGGEWEVRDQNGVYLIICMIHSNCGPGIRVYTTEKSDGETT
jgi:hypothetical protein